MTASSTSSTSSTSKSAANELRETVKTYWAAAEARDWDTVASTLADDVVYDLPQTRERIIGKEKYLRFNREYPGDWHARIERIVADGDQVVTWVRVTVGLEEMYAIAFFTGDQQGRIKAHDDFWPEPYEPPLGREHLVERY
ncbi:nuclear transport factor 2 family protein [Streptomyces sp. E11-3]|uniref:nuclear transport factor 2 family protein n=1 Tax=Streptomyces sp. E11-3 TaxID=3110112 RepID=UPI0039802AB0